MRIHVAEALQSWSPSGGASPATWVYRFLAKRLLNNRRRQSLWRSGDEPFGGVRVESLSLSDEGFPLDIPASGSVETDVLSHLDATVLDRGVEQIISSLPPEEAEALRRRMAGAPSQ